MGRRPKSFSSHDGAGGEWLNKKMNSGCFKLYRSHSISFKFSKVGQHSNGLNSKELYMSLEIKKKKIFFPCFQVLHKTYTIWQFHTVVGIDGKELACH